MEKRQTFTEGKILMPLLQFALPVLFALFLQSMYGAVDLLIVGHFGTARDVSAVSTGSQMMSTLTSVIAGFSMGTTVLLGQRIGQKRFEDAGKTVGASIVLFIIIGIIVTIGMFAIASPFATIMQAPEEAFDLTVLYVQICSAGSIFIIAYNVLGSIFRGIGNSKLPLITVAIACIFNVFGDLLFVAAFHMGVAGAALATIIAQAISVALSLVIIKRTPLPFTFHVKYIRFDSHIIKKILLIGTPIALQDLLVNISFLVIMAIVNTLGVIVSAGVGVAQKLCGFVMLVPSSFMQSMSAFTAQNIGAGKPERAKKALLYGILSSLCVGIVMAWASIVHGDILSSIFAKDHEVILASADYLKSYGIDCLFTAFLFNFIGYFNGCQKTTFVMLQGLIGAFGVRIPVSYFMSKIPEVSLFKIGLATPASTIVQIVLCIGFYIYCNRQAQKKIYI